MNVEPRAADLLDIARATILGNLAPELPESRRYEALMVANALAIAARDLAAPSAAAAELARLAALLPGWEPSPDEAIALREGTALLAARIREAHYDEADARSRLLSHLRETVKARLSVSNPKALAREHRSAP